jgi:hypothetical protein
MTSPAVTDSQPPEIQPPQSDTVEARASIVLKILAVINLAGVVLAEFPPLLPQSQLHTLTFNVAACALAAIEIVEARGLDRRRPWAVAVVRLLLVLLLASGVGAMVVGFEDGHIRVPFEAAFAIWAMLAAADVTLVGRTDRRSLSLVAMTILLVASQVFGQPLFGWGGVLDVRQSDLRASIDADCGAPADGPPPMITVAYDWSWARTSPLPSGLDIVVVGWTGSDAAGRPVYYFDDAPNAGPGVYPGRRDYPSIDMAEQVAKGSQGSWNWGIELGQQGLQPGHFELRLRRARDNPPEPTPLVITASYVHLGIWHSDPVSVTCTW